jgi:predicted transposase YbfD/YdcC
MNVGATGSIEQHFASLRDPRVERTKRHKLLDIVVIAICGVMCGADGWTDIEAFGAAKEEWLRTFLELPNGIPSHDTFGRVFARLEPREFERCFMKWVGAISELLRGQVVALDGKCLRRSHDEAHGQAALTVVSAWATENQLVLGQQAVDSKSNEITALPALLKLLDVNGCIVSVDAIGCQREVAAQVVEQGGDYLLALKENQAHLHEDVQSLFEWADNTEFYGLQHDIYHTTNLGHGRWERRECWTISDPSCMTMLADLEQWEQLRTVIRVRAQRSCQGHTTTETRYFISSLAGDTPKPARTALEAVRGHWGIENGLHWVLDIAFREDECRIRRDHAPENFAILRRAAVSLLKQEKSTRLGVHAKRLKAGWDTAYLLKILSQ